MSAFLGTDSVQTRMTGNRVAEEQPTSLVGLSDVLLKLVNESLMIVGNIENGITGPIPEDPEKNPNMPIKCVQAQLHEAINDMRTLNHRLQSIRVSVAG